jgi:hypothetical protein
MGDTDVDYYSASTEAKEIDPLAGYAKKTCSDISISSLKICIQKHLNRLVDLQREDEQQGLAIVSVWPPPQEKLLQYV